jgi:N-methylhydantoinase A
MTVSHALMPTIGIDVGGTFTDFVAVMPDGSLLFHKQPSTPDDPSLAVSEGLGTLLGRHTALEGGTIRIVHGTTLALNAILQHKVADVALVVSRGHRDVLEIGRAKLRTPYNIHLNKEQPVVPRRHIFELDARIAADGSILGQPDAAAIDALTATIAASGVGAVAIMLLNSYVSPALEAEVAEAIRARLPDLPVTCSAEIWPEMREFERAVVACINAQIHPLMEDYLAQLGARVERATRAVLQLTSSSGGMLGLASANQRPIDTVLSGPASGATAAAKLCKAAGMKAALSFDMGGTSADIAIVTDGEVEFTTSARIGDLPLMMPVVGVSSIGAGGGSIVSVDAYGVIKVGPESAGARPGPVAYGLGGTQPTVTDCYLVLGFIDPDRFLGGTMPLDADRATRALAEVATRLGLPTATHAAEAALRVATVRMASELFKLLAQKGYEPSGHVLIPFGGAGPTHAVMLAEEAALAGVTVPTAAAIFCALGAAVADLRRDFVRSLGKVRLASLTDRLWANWQELEVHAQQWLDGEGVPIIGRRLVHAIDMQYAGQSFSLTVPIPAMVRAACDLNGVMRAFHQAHEAIYGFREPDHAIEAITQRLSIIGEVPKADLPDLAPGAIAPRSRGVRPVFHAGAWIDAHIYRREDLGAGAAIAGPAVIEQDDTTVWMPQGWSLTADRLGLLVLTRSDDHAA